MNHGLSVGLARCAAAVFLLMLAVRVFGLPEMVNHDAAVYLEAGARLLDGQRPYVDYIETNLPLIHLFSALPVWVGRFLDIAPTLPLNGLVLLASVASVWASDRLLRRSPHLGLRLAVPPTLAAYSLYVFLMLSFGQREHLFVLAYLPWLIVRSGRREGVTVGRWAALGVGLVMGMGIAPKPHFAMIALGVEAVEALRTRRWLVRTPEVLGVLMVAGAHVAYFALNLDVLAALIETLGHAARGYGAYVGVLFDEVTASELLLGLVVTFGVLLLPNRLAPGLVRAFGWLGLAGWVSYVLQGKWWIYHAFPAQAGLWLCIGYGVAGVWLAQFRLRRPWRSLAMAVALGAVVSYGLRFELLLPQVLALNNTAANFLPVIETYTPPNGRVMLVYTGTYPLYPKLPRWQIRNASRYLLSYPLPFAYYGYQGVPYDDPAHVVPPYAQRYLDHFAEDLRLHQPPLIVISGSPCRVACNDTAVTDLHDYLDARGVIDAVVLPDYERLTEEYGFVVYLRKGAQPVER